MCVLEFVIAYTSQCAFPLFKSFILIYVFALKSEMSFDIKLVVAL
jgi:hypothetical protein